LFNILHFFLLGKGVKRIMFKKGFTLVELLVVIALIGILAAAVVVLIDPVDKVHQANDSKVQSDLGQVATALQSYATLHNGVYPGTDWATAIAALSTAGELKAVNLTAPGGYVPYAAATANAGADVVVYSNLLSKRYGTGNPAGGNCPNVIPAGPMYAYWFWNSTNGKSCGSCQNTVPTTATACGGW
jgi:prepilin-type N-terminal cleavage/methylation domain-containing protein